MLGMRLNFWIASVLCLPAPISFTAIKRGVRVGGIGMARSTARDIVCDAGPCSAQV